MVIPRGAETVWSYADGIPAGRPAVTRHQLGKGTAWYVSTRPSAPTWTPSWTGPAPTPASRRAPASPTTSRSYAVRRSGTYLFAINHSGADTEVALDAPGTELLTGKPAADRLAVPAGAVRVVRLDG